jgi:hypothetical protein
MNIEVYAVCHNEEVILPYFIRHYSQFANITIFDNQSTDGSLDIIKQHNIKLCSFDTQGEFREDVLMDIRNNCWKESKADWVIITDIDEFVYHKNLISVLSGLNATVVFPRMFNMFSFIMPTTQGQLYDEVNMGVEFRGKMCMFKPGDITSMNYEAGNHVAHPEGNYIIDVQSGIINMHFKNLCQQYVINRNAYLFSRQSEVNRTHGWNWHIAETAIETYTAFNNVKTQLFKVV